jgi:hypothetical protein
MRWSSRRTGRLGFQMYRRTSVLLRGLEGWSEQEAGGTTDRFDDDGIRLGLVVQ